MLLVTALLAVSELKGAPQLTVHSPAGLYLVAEYKLAVGDTNSGLEFLSRALVERSSQPSQTTTLNACNVASSLPSL